MNSLAPSNHEVNAVQYGIGIKLYQTGKQEGACANKWQRQGWRDAKAGERACGIIDAVVASGGKVSDADRALAGEWR